MTLAVNEISIPDSKIAREIAELVRDTESPLLFHHSSRVYHGARWRASVGGYGLTLSCSTRERCFMTWASLPSTVPEHDRFEVYGANAARDFLQSRGIPQQEVDTVWTAIALHTTPGIPPHMHPVIALVTAGVEMDVLGFAYADYKPRGARGGRPCPSAQRQFQGRHHPGVLRRFRAQAGDDVWHRKRGRARRQRSELQTTQLLQRDPRIRVAGVTARRARPASPRRRAL